VKIISITARRLHYFLYTKVGVPKVTEYNSKNDSVGFSPYYADPKYKFYFERMNRHRGEPYKGFPGERKKMAEHTRMFGRRRRLYRVQKFRRQ